MPPDLETATIRPGAEALGLGLDEAQLRRLSAFAALLLRWNAVHNLTAIRSAKDLLTHHLLDSLAIAPHVAAVGEGRPRVLDVGSGGGLPGVVLAIALPEAHFTLVDAVQKKCAFLTQAKLDLGLDNVDVRHARVEALRLPPFDAIVSRALGTLAQLVAWTRHLLRPEGVWLAMKGRVPRDELAGLPADVEARAIELRVPGLNEQRNLIEMRRRR